MKIKTIRRKKWLTVAVVLGMIMGQGWFFYRKYEWQIHSWVDMQFRFLDYRMSKDIRHDLVVGNIKFGDDFEVVLKAHPIHNGKDQIGTRMDFGCWSEAHFFNGAHLIARDGKIVKAWMPRECTGSPDYFFSGVTSAEEELIYDTRHAWLVKQGRTYTTLVAFLTGAACHHVLDKQNKLTSLPLLEN